MNTDRHKNTTASTRAHAAADALGIERDWAKVFGITITNCCICGKPLRDAVSVNRGMGPDCSQEHYDIAHEITDDMLAKAMGVLYGSGLDYRVKHEARGLHDKPRELCNLLVWWSSANLNNKDVVLECAHVIQELGFESMASRLKERNTEVVITRDDEEGFYVLRHRATLNVRRNMQRMKGVKPLAREGRFKYGWKFPKNLKSLVWKVLGEDFGNQWATVPGKHPGDLSQVVKIDPASAWDVRKAWDQMFPRPTLTAKAVPNKAASIVRIQNGAIEIHTPNRNFAFVDALKLMVPYKQRDWCRKECCWKVKDLSLETRIRDLVSRHFNGMV